MLTLAARKQTDVRLRCNCLFDGRSPRDVVRSAMLHSLQASAHDRGKKTFPPATGPWRRRAEGCHVDESRMEDEDPGARAGLPSLLRICRACSNLSMQTYRLAKKARIFHDVTREFKPSVNFLLKFGDRVVRPGTELKPALVPPFALRNPPVVGAISVLAQCTGRPLVAFPEDNLPELPSRLWTLLMVNPGLCWLQMLIVAAQSDFCTMCRPSDPRCRI